LKTYEQELGISIIMSEETEPLGTAGPLALAKNLLKGDEPFFVLNSDVICTFPFQHLLDFHKKHGKEGTIMVTQVEEPSKYGVVVSEAESGKILRFVEKPQIFVGNNINAGIYMFNSSILDRIEVKPTSIEKEVFPKMANEGQLYCVALEGFWMDVGQPKDYLQGMSLYLHHLHDKQSEELSHSPGIIPPVLIHKSAVIGDGCIIGPNVSIGQGCVIENGVRLANCALLTGSVVRSNTLIKNSIIGWNCEVGSWTRVESYSVLGADVHINNELYVNGGKILPNKTISDNIPLPEVIM